MKPTIRLSQCMIVKNEEKNIRRALSWGKGIVWEQIVVDTGSSDNTVQIAEEMGAKVLHFSWNNDFSSAKNFALEHAKGDWIAFLDADEYFSDEDAKKIIPLLKKMEKQFPPQKRPKIVRSMLANLDDTGNVFSTAVQSRIFKNTPLLRYENRIHEQLSFSGNETVFTLDATSLLTIYHTGYAESAYKETGKIGRNISLLEDEVRAEPQNYNAWSYLGDTFLAEGRFDKAESAYRLVMEHMGESIIEDRRELTFCNLLKIKYMTQWKEESDVLSIYQSAKTHGCSSPDLEYWLGLWYYQQGEDEKGRACLELALSLLDKHRLNSSLALAGDLNNVYQKVFMSFKKSDRPSDMIRYGILALRLDLYQEDILKDILLLLKKEAGEEETAQTTFGFLSKLYNVSSVKDRFFLLKVSKMAYFSAFEEKIYNLLSCEEKELLNQKKVSLHPASENMREEPPGFKCRNELDWEYLGLMKEIISKEVPELMDSFKNGLFDLEKSYGGVLEMYQENFLRFPFWGEISFTEDNYKAIENRISCVKKNAEYFLWFYQSLSDYQSKRILTAILKNWLYADTGRLSRVKRNQDDYYDLDLIPEGNKRIFVDAGAYFGDTCLKYIKTYGEDYKEIICYEPNEASVKRLEENMAGFERIKIRSVGLDSVSDERFLCINEDDPILAFFSSDESSNPVKTTSIDLDIEAAIDILKIDVNGYEAQVLLGAENHIRKDRPNLVVALYHGFEDIIKIPRMIKEMNPDYKFYVRYYGGDLIPTNFVLYAI